MQKHVLTQSTAALKDDWAWWQWNGELSSCGKLVTLIPGRKPTLQMFFDDNIDQGDIRIVDCRDANGKPLPQAQVLGRICVKVNPVEAVLDEDYFLRKLTLAQGGKVESGDSIMASRSSSRRLRRRKARSRSRSTI